MCSKSRTFESDLFLRFKDISFTVVSFIMMEEGCYTISFLRFKYKSFTVVPFVIMKENCCMGVKANAEMLCSCV